MRRTGAGGSDNAPVTSPDSLAAAVDARCRITGQFQLRSGRTATEYFDKYLFETDPAMLRGVVDRMAPLVPLGTQLLGALELGGVPIATLIAQKLRTPLLLVRKQAKPYGTRKLAEGEDPSGRTVCLVEDVVTSGGAVLNAARALRDLGATVTDVVCAIDREESGTQALVAEGLTLHPAFTRSVLDAARATS